ncbi:hypothetical protein OIV83_000067 [Microbotryomycetes sp. JL201]|nr:hypothetical protein OIV83_000067 [Microbotryomycetes sp. JL201]
MSDGVYHKTGGALKLKGGPVGPANKKKKKTKSSTSEKARHGDDALALTKRDGDEAPGHASGHDSDSATAGSGQYTKIEKTEAQRRFEEVQKKRMLEKAAKAATKSHKDRVAEFNAKLERLSEHHDMPRIGPG